MKQATGLLSSLVMNETVRALVSDLLRDQQERVKHLIRLCKAKELEIAIGASTAVAFLLLSPQNHLMLRGHRALEFLRAFTERDPLEEGAALNVTTDHVLQYCQLLSASLQEVIDVFAWMTARMASDNTMINPNTAALVVRSHCRNVGKGGSKG